MGPLGGFRPVFVPKGHAENGPTFLIKTLGLLSFVPSGTGVAQAAGASRARPGVRALGRVRMDPTFLSWTRALKRFPCVCPLRIDTTVRCARRMFGSGLRCLTPLDG